jgi:SAM-dependent methyltransferase
MVLYHRLLVVCQHVGVSDADVLYRRNLAMVHHKGFGFHAAACAPGILDILAPVRARQGLVLELGCGTGLLTRELIAAGHQVIATDASAGMLEVARDYLAEGAPTPDLRQLALPDDSLPPADAIVAIGHPLNYLHSAESIDQALVAIARALRPGGVVALDLCDLEWGIARRASPNYSAVGEDWAIITRFATPRPGVFVRDITTFTANLDGSWRRDDEHHENVLIDTALVPPLMLRHGVEAEVRSSFGTETLPVGLKAIVGRRPPA